MMHAPLDKKLWTTAEIDDVATIVARTNFLAFRRQIRPHMLVGWWIEEVADHLQQFYDEMMAGNRPKLAITAPPQTACLALPCLAPPCLAAPCHATPRRGLCYV
jgi:hypothetical protein